MKRFASLLLLLAIAFAPSIAKADLLASDNFTYPDGASLTAQTGWAGHSGTPGDLLVTGGQAVVQHGAPSEDANLAFADVVAGALTANFDMSVTSAAVIGTGGTDFEYFAHFFTDGNFNFRSRLDIVAPTGAGDYTLGISSTSSTAEAVLTNDFAFGDTVAVELGFDATTGIGSLMVNGETIVGTSAAVGETINRFALRQSDSSENEAITIDNLFINGTAAVPEPGSAALLGLFGIALVARRRK